ncbi:MAG: hypothetical protein R3B54_17605 [Bdellovibrionota bacterium]
MKTTLRLWSVVGLLIVGGFAFSEEAKRLSSRLENPDEVRKYYGIESDLVDKAEVSGIKVAVLSKGFRGVEEQDKKIDEFFRKRYLPESMRLIADYEVASLAWRAATK